MHLFNGRRHTPATLLQTQFGVIAQHLDGIRDADVESVHQARIATRRVRELLALIEPPRGWPGPELKAEIRRLGRRLGRVRELDVMVETLAEFERRVPPVAPVAALARARVATRRDMFRRRLIRASDQLDLPELIRVVRNGLSERAPLLHRRRAASWSERLRLQIVSRAAAVRENVIHSSGVYFPERAHPVRIAVKKLRYAVEIASATALWTPPHMLKDLRRIQDTLGELHDLQVVRPEILGLAVEDIDPQLVQIMEGILDGEIERLFRRYLDRRDRLLLMCRVCERQRHQHAWRLPRLIAA
jgi:CHAD domain-containing protein